MGHIKYNQDTACRIRSLEEEFEESRNYEDSNEHNLTREQNAIDISLNTENHGNYQVNTTFVRKIRTVLIQTMKLKITGEEKTRNME